MAKVNFAALPAVNAGHVAAANIQSAQLLAYQATEAAAASAPAPMSGLTLGIIALGIFVAFKYLKK